MKKQLIFLITASGIALALVCTRDSECQDQYQECKAGQCTCKYGNEAFECLGPNFCHNFDDSYCITNAWCIGDRCECKREFRTLTNSNGKITECYIIHCNKDDECGVFENCKNQRCTCSHWSEPKPQQNTTCRGQWCSEDGDCDDDNQQCNETEEECVCKDGMILRSNRTAVCAGLSKYSGLTTEEIVGINFGIIGFGVIVVLAVWCVIRNKERNRHIRAALTTRTSQNRGALPQLRSSTIQLLNLDLTPSTLSVEYHSMPHTPGDDPPSYDEPPSYGVAVGMPSPEH